MLVLHITSVQYPGGWQATWALDDAPVGDRITVTGPAAAAIADSGRRFLELFEAGRRPLVPPEVLRAFGRTLFDAWFAPVWALAMARLASVGGDLLIRS